MRYESSMENLSETTTEWGMPHEKSRCDSNFNEQGLFAELIQWLCLAPAFVKAIFFVVSFAFLIEGAHVSSTGFLLHKRILAGPLYGPPTPAAGWRNPKSSAFSQAGPAFDKRLALWRFEEIGTNRVKSIILAGTSKRLQKGLKRHIDVALHYSEVFQVDPIWVLSVMWVESNFNPGAVSQVKAQGLMQIMPATSHYLNKLMDRLLQPVLASELTKFPGHNVELGVFYLKRLLKKFKGNYIHATVAYNMGPGYTVRRLRLGLPVGSKNLYLDKVRRAYSRLSRGFLLHFKENAAKYVKTYVTKRRWLYEWQQVQLLTWWEEEVGGGPLYAHPLFIAKRNL